MTTPVFEISLCNRPFFELFVKNDNLNRVSRQRHPVRWTINIDHPQKTTVNHPIRFQCHAKSGRLPPLNANARANLVIVNNLMVEHRPQFLHLRESSNPRRRRIIRHGFKRSRIGGNFRFFSHQIPFNKAESGKRRKDLSRTIKQKTSRPVIGKNSRTALSSVTNR